MISPNLNFRVLLTAKRKRYIMDIDLFPNGEQFSTFGSHNLLDTDDSTSLDGMQSYNYEWDMDHEKEINGDIALIPMTSENVINGFSSSPPTKDEFNKFINDWQFSSIESSLPLEAPLITPEENQLELLTQRDTLADLFEIDEKKFDLAKYINEVDDLQSNKTASIASEPRIKAGVKKIDMKKQKYIVEEDEEDLVDVETVDEQNTNSAPILEARDLNSLLEQFEATEIPDLTPINDLPPNLQSFSAHETDNMKFDPILGSNCEQIHLKKELKAQQKNTDEKLQENNVIKATTSKQQTTTNEPKIKRESCKDEISPDLLQRLKEASKKRTIAVIPPVAITKKRGKAESITKKNNFPNNENSHNESKTEIIHLDHDYCNHTSNSSANSSIANHKQTRIADSGFESAEEDEKTIGNQPTVKNADGKLMVSLLKANTIKNPEKHQKRKLNLEEYKKRREGVLTKSTNSSPSSSACSSPLPEDEYIKRKKHQEKLMQMAEEVLKTVPKSNEKTQNNVIPVQKKTIEKKSIIPDDFEMKTYVSIGVNTDFLEESLMKVEGLEEIKPLLQKASDKINSNSLLTAVIENIPKVIGKNKEIVKNNVNEHKMKKSNQNDNISEHGEDKTIVYLPKQRESVKMKSTGMQTNISLIKFDEEIEARYRRRLSETGYSKKYSRRRSSDSSSSSSSDSESSTSSYSYRSPSRSRSRSRSRSKSPISPPKKFRKRDRSREIKEESLERRVIYVGGISANTTKEDLRRRFQRFGPITSTSVHFRRDHGDHYGFVTFANKLDAYEAFEHGNDDPSLPQYDLSFGGRREFCQTSYSDLDNMREDTENYYVARDNESSFDMLLKEMQEKLRKRKA